MTAFVPNASSVGPSIVFASVAVNDSVTFLPAFTFINTTTNAVNLLHANNTLLNMTTLMSGGSYGIVVNSVDDCDIINSATGTIATLSGIFGYNAVFMSGARNTLTNDGYIYSVNGSAVFLAGSDEIVTNSGRIQGNESGIVATSLNYSIANSGIIECGAGILASAVYLAGTGAGKVLVNTGVIQSLGAGSGTAVTVTAHDLTTIVNSGTIRALGGVGIDAGAATGAIHLTNSGIISSSAAFVLSVGGTALADTIINTGSINRSVGMGDGDDLFDGIGGFVGGTVFGGDGNDTYRVSDALLAIFEAGGEGTADHVLSSVNFALAAGSEIEQLTLLGAARDGTGNDLANTITGNGADNRLFGLSGNDNLLGAGGNDLIDGGALNDTLDGGFGDDRLVGRQGADSLLGQEGEDVLLGGGGIDTLSGGEGDDTLIGGALRDNLYGGADADSFVLRTIGESGPDTATRDTIFDFEAGLDLLNLAAIDAVAGLAGNQAFTFIGTAAFTGVAGQLRYSVTGGAMIVEATVNADTIADFSIRLMAETVLAVDDVIL